MNLFFLKKKRMDLGQFENNFPFDVEDSFELPLRPRSELVTVDSRSLGRLGQVASCQAPNGV